MGISGDTIYAPGVICVCGIGMEGAGDDDDGLKGVRRLLFHFQDHPASRKTAYEWNTKPLYLSLGWANHLHPHSSGGRRNAKVSIHSLRVSLSP